MKKYILLQFVLNFYLLLSSQPSIKVDTVAQINQIKSLYSQFNKDSKKYIKKDFNITGESTEGGNLTIYYISHDVKKMVVTFYGETGKSITEFYVKNKTPFFVLKSQVIYVKPIYEKNMKILSKDEERYYFFEKKMIKWKDNNGKLIVHNNGEFKRKEMDILLEFDRFLNYFHTK